MAADLVQEELERVRRDGRERGVVDRRLGSVLARAVVPQLDVARMQVLIEGGEVLVLELEALRELVDLAQVHATALFSAIDEGPDGPAVGVSLLAHG